MLPAPEPESREFSEAHLRWLVQLRWIAMSGVTLAGIVSAVGLFPGVAWPVLLATVSVGVAYNALVHLSFRKGRPTEAPWRSAYVQGFVDFSLLTVVLWAAGGVTSPFLGFYVFHVILFGILGGPRALLLATIESLAMAGLLAVVYFIPPLQIGGWNPVDPWDYLSDVLAFVITIGTSAYLVSYAVRQLRDREQALAEARDRAALEYELLSRSLNELEAGLEVLNEEGEVVWQNRRAEELGPWIDLEAGQNRFAARVDQQERIYERLVVPLSIDRHGHTGAMNLYIDRTQATLAERQLTIAERLASLGRIAQGVAHELNTPLATIRTLATDMRAALKAAQANNQLDAISDLDESASLIHDETRRLGKITHALLAGRDLSGPSISGSVPLVAALERARALVFAGSRPEERLIIDPSTDGRYISVDADRFVQILVNLLQNAYDAVRPDPNAKIYVRAEETEEEIIVSLDDEGPGIDPRMADRLFEPFATTKPPGEGTGLGLYTSYMLVKMMGGRLQLEPRSAHGAGTRATVRLPRVNALESPTLSLAAGDCG